ncbi:DNA mismatch repair protein MutS [Labeo rohita]|uniref:DNA mismatch repair protein MutS n=1 Tax=Labeo rohita TaxID=84645 RepID=A0ABQ8MGZ7_LABRO|nr:DNA mismatch repair protein MutS [Labeo rohita]
MNIHEHWRVVFACRATPPYIRVYKKAACNHSFRLLLLEPRLLSYLKKKKKEKEFLSSHSLCWRAAELLKELHLKERSAAASLILRAAVFTASTPPALQRAPRLSARLCRGFSLGGPGFQKSEFLAAVEDIFPVCLSGRALPGVVVSSPLWTDVIAVSRAWAESTLRQRSRMSRCSFMSRHPLLSSRGKSLSRQGFSAAAARHLGDIQVTMQNVPSAPKAPRTSASPRSPVELPKQYTSPYSGLGISFCAPQEIEMSAAASEGESDDEADDSAGRYPSAVAAPSETDAELSAMLLRAAKEIGLEVPKTPPADPSRLDDWFLGRAPPRSPPVPFFPEVHEELVRTWRAPHSSRPRPSSSPLASLDGGAARGYEAVPQVERAVAVHLCPPGAATWRNRPNLPSRACEFSSALAGRTYHAAGQAATALHAMATLQVYQAKVLKHLHEGCSDQGAMEELRAATDFALRATKVTARSLGQVMSTIVVQERHLWLTLAQMADVDKSRFLERRLNTSCPAATFQPCPQGPNLRLLVAEGAPPRLPNNQLRPLLRYMTPDWQPDVELAVGERRRPRLRDPSPAKNLRSVPDAGNLEVERIALWGMTTSTSPLPVEGRKLSQKESILSPPGFRPRVPSLSSAPEVSPRIRTRSLMSPAREPGKKVSAAQCSLTFLQDVLPSGISPLPLPPRLPHCGHVGQRPFDTPGDQAGSLASASQPLAVVDSDGTSRLCDSVRQASAQVQRRPFHFCPFGHTCRCASCGGCSPTGEGRNRACPSSRDEVRVLQSLLHRAQKERWVKTHPGSSSPESVPSQAAVQDAHDEAHANMHSSPGLVRSHRPEGRVLSRLDPASTQTLPTVCFLMDPCAISLGCSLRRTWVLHAPQSGLVRNSACLCSGWVSFAQQVVATCFSIFPRSARGPMFPSYIPKIYGYIEFLVFHM